LCFNVDLLSRVGRFWFFVCVSRLILVVLWWWWFHGLVKMAIKCWQLQLLLKAWSIVVAFGTLHSIPLSRPFFSNLFFFQRPHRPHPNCRLIWGLKPYNII
jgi:hypothetical protein